MNWRVLRVAGLACVLTGGLLSPAAAEEPAPTPDEATSSKPVVPEKPTETPPTSTSPTSTPPIGTPSAAPSKPPAVTPAAAWSITLNQPAASWEDRPLVFTGKISKPIANSYITLWQRIPGRWVKRAATRTAANGSYRFVYTSTVPLSAAFQTTIGATREKALAISPYRTATAKNRQLVVTKPAAWYGTLTGVTLRGRMTPGERGRELALQLYLGNNRWSAISITRMDSTGYFRFRVADNVPSTRAFRVVTRGVSAAAMERSAAFRVVVKAVLNPKVYAVTARTVSKTYRAGCPVRPSSLRLLQLNYWGFDGKVHRGELVLRDAAVAKMITVWTASLNARFPIRQMRRVDVFGGSDIKAMAADNTSAFNCRRVTGNPYALSPHSYGYAIDINTVENPYLAANNVWYPKNGLSYRNRKRVRPGMLFSSSMTTKTLVRQGYFWGALWRKPDYQHFQPK